jgi:hypothetical protein
VSRQALKVDVTISRLLKQHGLVAARLELTALLECGWEIVGQSEDAEAWTWTLVKKRREEPEGE